MVNQTIIKTISFSEVSSNALTYVFYYNKTNEIGFYLLLVTVPVGLIGNLAAIFIFTRPKLNRNTNTGFLYTILCIFNIIKILYQAIFKRWTIHSKFKIKLHFNGETIIEYVILQMLSWIEVLIVFDRFIAVFSPIKGVRIMRKKWVLYSINLGFFAFILCTNIPIFLKYTMSNMFYLNNYTFVDNSEMIYDAIKYSTFKIIIEVHLPYLIMVVLDILVIIRLRRSKMNIVSLINPTNAQTKNIRASKFTFNTILIDLIYLIVNLPFTICNLINIINLYMTLRYNSSKVLEFISFLFQRLPFIYSSFIFVIFICFNRNFRSEFFSIGIVVKLKHFILSVIRANR